MHRSEQKGFWSIDVPDYDFSIRKLFEDLQYGIILCRVVHLLLLDASIILVRIRCCNIKIVRCYFHFHDCHEWISI